MTKGGSMVKKEKVILMTRLAIEEKTDPRYRFITGSFWFDDYASKELWEAFFAISFAYALVVLLGLIAYGDSWTVTYHIADAMELARISDMKGHRPAEKYLRHLRAFYEEEGEQL